jgi:hypothetical protein
VLSAVCWLLAAGCWLLSAGCWLLFAMLRNWLSSLVYPPQSLTIYDQLMYTVSYAATYICCMKSSMIVTYIIIPTITITIIIIIITIIIIIIIITIFINRYSWPAVSRSLLSVPNNSITPV